MTARERHARKAKLTEVDYAVLSSGQQIPEYSTEEDPSSSDDDAFTGGKRRSRKPARKKNKHNGATTNMGNANGNGHGMTISGGKNGQQKYKGCFICQRESKSAFLECDQCSRWYHVRCGKPFESSSVLGNTSCHEVGDALQYKNRAGSCLQENKVQEMSALPRKQLNSLADFINILKNSKNILVVAGAGMSVSCGIPDFRSNDGIYAMVKHMDMQLPEPECLFQIEYFRQNPAPFFQLAQNVFASSPTPSPTHHFLKLLQDKNKLLRVYTQNIDGLEEAAGVTKYIPCHGSFAYSSCMKCKQRVATREIMHVIQAGVIPTCSSPDCRGVLKPEITFFGEMLSDHVSTSITKDRLNADLFLVIGTSLKVSPVAEIPGFLPKHIPQVVINKTPLKKKKKNKLTRSKGHKVASQNDDDFREEFDLSLLGNCDDIVQYICEQSGWELPCLDADKKKNEPMKANADVKVISHVEEAKRKVYCFGVCHCNGKLAIGEEELDGDSVELVVCDGCAKSIEKKTSNQRSSTPTHFSCNDCFDFDLCAACYPSEKYKHKNSQHTFSPM